MTDERLGQNIREIRKSKGLTQQYIADKVGISKQMICRIEKGNHASQETINRIARALFVDIQELYEPINKDKSSLYEYRDFMTSDEKNTIIFEYMTPMIARLNDTVASNFAKRIRENCIFSEEQFQTMLKNKGYSSKKSYTSSELRVICKEWNDELIQKIYSILTDYNQE